MSTAGDEARTILEAMLARDAALEDGQEQVAAEALIVAGKAASALRALRALRGERDYGVDNDGEVYPAATRAEIDAIVQRARKRRSPQ